MITNTMIYVSMYTDVLLSCPTMQYEHEGDQFEMKNQHYKLIEHVRIEIRIRKYQSIQLQIRNPIVILL